MKIKMLSNIICLIVVLFLAISFCTPKVQAAESDLSIEIIGVEKEESDINAEFVFKNNAGARISFGWVNSCEILVTTTDGMFSYLQSSFDYIPRGDSSCVITFYDCSGDIKKVEITELCLLDNDGLPGRELHNIVVYDSEKGIESFSGNFSFFSSPQEVMSVIFGIVFLAVAVFVVIAIVRGIKANKAASQPFAPFGMPQNFGTDFQQQAMDAHRQAMDAHQQMVNIHDQAHQQAVNNAISQQNDMFAHQSVTTIDMGGFNPPPPPPPTGF